MSAPIPERHQIDYAMTDPEVFVTYSFPAAHTRKLIEEIAAREQLIRESLPYLAAYNTSKCTSEIYRRAEELLK